MLRPPTERYAFDARAARLLQPGKHRLTIEGCQGLRLTAARKGYAWGYRYKSPIDGEMRQTKLGGWPSMSFHAAVAEWEKARRRREEGVDLSMERKAQRQYRARG